MAREQIVVKGIVLRGTDTRESDKILTVLTAAGKLRVIAKGARGRRSRVTAAAQLLAYSELTVSEKGEWYFLSEASTIALFEGVRQDIELLSLASYFAELVEAVTLEEMDSGSLLRLLLNALYALGNLKKPPELVKAAFELKVMALTGFEPLADGCAVCGRPEPEDPVLDIVDGVVRCRRCSGGRQGLAVPLTPGALAALRYILYGDEKRLYSFRLGEKDLEKLSNAAEAYLHAMLERGFRTLDFYKSLHIPAIDQKE